MVENRNRTTNLGASFVKIFAGSVTTVIMWFVSVETLYNLSCCQRNRHGMLLRIQVGNQVKYRHPLTGSKHRLLKGLKFLKEKFVVQFDRSHHRQLVIEVKRHVKSTVLTSLTHGSTNK